MIKILKETAAKKREENNKYCMCVRALFFIQQNYQH